MVINVALTLPLAFTIGMLGVPIGTALGLIASNLYFLHIARREIDRKLRSFFADIPRLAVILGVVTTACLELPAYMVAPRGAAGLIICAIPALIGLGVYAVVVMGVKQTFTRPFGWTSRSKGAVAPEDLK
jgi:O-antigen/teichoic acid export membrane protein